MKRVMLALILLVLMQVCQGCASWAPGELTGDELNLRQDAMDWPTIDGQREREPRHPTQQR